MKTLFIESWCDDEHIIEENVRRVKISSPDVSAYTLPTMGRPLMWLVYWMDIGRCCEALLVPNLSPDPSISNDGGEGIELYQGILPYPEPALLVLIMRQMMNAGERLIVNNRSFGYLSNRIVFYLLNLHTKARRTYFARVSGASHVVVRVDQVELIC